MLACRLANGELFRMVGREADTRLDIAALFSVRHPAAQLTPVMVLASCEVRHQAVIANGIATALGSLGFIVRLCLWMSDCDERGLLVCRLP
jgi:hypothetical protein